MSKQGYAQMKVDGRSRLAHRVSHEEFVGPIPDGMQVDHTCHGQDASCTAGSKCVHRRCVNPAHLEAVTPAVNVARSRNDTRANLHDYYEARRGRPTCPRGHEWDEENTRQTDTQRYCRACQRENMAAYRARQPAQEPKPRVPATQCRKGHPYDEANTYWRAGARFCRACRAQQSAALRARRKL